MRQGEGAQVGGWSGGMADDGERAVEKEVGLQLAIHGGGAGRGGAGDGRRWRLRWR